jgi:hypothetical protein
MTESTLSVQFTDLQIAIANQMGLGADSTGWSTAETAAIARIIKKGLRQFYFPPQINQNEPPHQWSFLKPVCQLTTVAPYETGTIAIALAGTIVTLTTGVWPSWTATNGTIEINGVDYAIASRTDDDHIVLSSAWTEATETAATFILKHNGNYDLPDDFGGIEGRITYSILNSLKGDIKIVGEGKIRSLRSGLGENSFGEDPIYAAIRPKEQTTTTTGQRFEIMLFPAPSESVVLEYKQLILPEALVATTLTHPYGGMIHAETIEASCLAIAEMNDDDKSKGNNGPQWKYFLSRLTASIQADKRQNGIDYFGYNGDSTNDVCDVRCKRNNSQCRITYNGTTY